MSAKTIWLVNWICCVNRIILTQRAFNDLVWKHESKLSKKTHRCGNIILKVISGVCVVLTEVSKLFLVLNFVSTIDETKTSSIGSFVFYKSIDPIALMIHSIILSPYHSYLFPGSNKILWKNTANLHNLHSHKHYFQRQSSKLIISIKHSHFCQSRYIDEVTMLFN